MYCTVRVHENRWSIHAESLTNSENRKIRVQNINIVLEMWPCTAPDGSKYPHLAVTSCRSSLPAVRKVGPYTSSISSPYTRNKEIFTRKTTSGFGGFKFYKVNKLETARRTLYF
jgi:hypothetical protein